MERMLSGNARQSLVNPQNPYVTSLIMGINVSANLLNPKIKLHPLLITLSAAFFYPEINVFFENFC